MGEHSAAWQTASLGEVMELQRGHDLPANEREPGAVPIIGSFGITGFHAVSRYDGPGVAIGRSGASIGCATMVAGPYWPLNTCLFVRDFKGNDPRWVYLLLDSIDFGAFNSGSAQPSLNRNFLTGIPVELPPHAEQVAIAEVLGALDDKIAANVRVAGLIRDSLRLRFASLGVIPSEAEDGDAALDTFVDLNPKTVVAKDAERVPFLEMKNLPSDGMTVSDWDFRAPKGGVRFRDGDTLLARITPCLENGKTGYVDFLGEEVVGVGSTEYIVMRPRDGVPDAFVYCLAVDDSFREFAVRHMVGTSGRQRVSAADLAKYRVNAPSPAELNRFGDLSVVLLHKVKAAVRESSILARTRDELLPLLMSGRVTVRDAERTVSNVV